MAGQRFAELDFIRGLCLLVMIICHLAWDLHNYYGYPAYYNDGWLYWCFIVTAPIFMVLAGISSFFTRSHKKRAFRVLFFAMVITLFTFFYDRNQMIMFGILHFMGVNMLLYPYYRKLNPWLLTGIALVVIGLGRFVAGIDMLTDVLFPLGLRSDSYRSFDYFPMIPYAGFFMIGTVLGPVLYPNRKSRLNLRLPPNPISYMGQHSLTVYVLHQPILVVLLYLLHMQGFV
ncbi:MAG: DUF1624 domain-containing protein [Clostridia bacterium]|jgi:uncharacterized membrane protein|nr:DUF1624 domain-containing protein [Clostridia bacterium]